MDKFIAAYKDAVMAKYAKFDGRLGVGGYWRFAAVNIAAVVVLLILARVSVIFLILCVGYWLALLIPSLAAGVRRLHDTGKSGWMILLGLIPLVGGIIVLVFLVQAGDPNPNQYGPPEVA